MEVGIREVAGVLFLATVIIVLVHAYIARPKKSDKGDKHGPYGG